MIENEGARVLAKLTYLTARLGSRSAAHDVALVTPEPSAHLLIDAT